MTTVLENKEIIGKKVILFDMQPVDLHKFVELHRADNLGMMCRFSLNQMTDDEARNYVVALLATGQIKVWSAYTKEGKASRMIGFIYLSDITAISACISGILDKSVIEGLRDVLRKDKYTFTQDCLHTLIDYCFKEIGLERISVDMISTNRLAISLIKREGFTQEGVLRHCLKINGDLKDIAIFSILKEEYHG